MSDDLERIRLLSLQDGDVVVLKTDRPLTAVEVSCLRKQWQALISGVAVRTQMIILEPGFDIELITDNRAKQIRAILDE